MMVELNVAAELKVMPSGVDVDLDAVKSEAESIVNEFGKLHSFEIQPIAFGLKALILRVLLSDAAGGIDELQSKLKTIEGVNEVEVGDVSRI